MTARVALVLGVLIWTVTAGAATAAAQQPSTEFGFGGRFSFVKVDAAADDDSVRFTGGVVRLAGKHTSIEVALDYKSALTGDLLERVTDIPIQASLLYYPVRTRIAPYLLGGVGWYSQNIKRFTAPGDETPMTQDTTRRLGSHIGLGADLRLHRRLALHGDYRYTFLHLGDDDTAKYSSPSLIPFAKQFKLSHEGTMFTWGAVVYF
jgi:hypothetical protein